MGNQTKKQFSKNIEKLIGKDAENIFSIMLKPYYNFELLEDDAEYNKMDDLERDDVYDAVWSKVKKQFCEGE